MKALIAASRNPDYPAEIVLVVSNRPAAAGLEYARKKGIPTEVVDHKQFQSRQDFDVAIEQVLTTHGVELVALAGFMRIMTPGLVGRWHGRMINIHPSLLPSFKGLDTHDRAIEAGVRIHGCTVHFVDAELDSGPIIAQAAVAVRTSDDARTLSKRVLTAEHRLYPYALKLVAQGKIRLDGDNLVSEVEEKSRRAMMIP